MRTPKGMICQIIQGTNGFPIKHCTLVVDNIKKHAKKFKERSEEGEFKQWCAKSTTRKANAKASPDSGKVKKWAHNALAQNGVE